MSNTVKNNDAGGLSPTFYFPKVLVADPSQFPKLLLGWVGFGPIGVAMALMTTCTVIAALWVITACMGAVLWERNAGAETVIASQHDRPATDPAATRR